MSVAAVPYILTWAAGLCMCGWGGGGLHLFTFHGLSHGVCPPSFWLPTGPQLVGFLPGSGPGVRFWIGGGGAGVPGLRSLRLEVVGFGSGVVHTQVSCLSRCVNLGYA